MRRTEHRPGCLHEHALHEVFSSLRAGIYAFTPEIQELIWDYDATLDAALRAHTKYASLLERLYPILEAMEVHGSWYGIGSEIDFEKLNREYEPSPQESWRLCDFPWRTVQWN
jgi:NDP-sugar pyrophosphorylase family protein